MKLDQAAVVITGGSSGLGKELARQLVAAGARVLITSTTAPTLKAAAEEVGASYIVSDITSEKATQEVYKEAIRQFGRIDLWINNAGVWTPWSPPDEIDMARVRAMFEVNVFGVMNGFKAVLPYFRNQNKGIILTVVSTSGLMPRPKSTAYAASKWGARGYILSAREALKDSGILILGAYPDQFKSNIFGSYKIPNYDTYMPAEVVAQAIVKNLRRTKPVLDQKILLKS